MASPRISRRPAWFTAQAIIAATETHASALPHLEVGGLQPQIGPFALDRPIEERAPRSSISSHRADTWDLLMPVSPKACTRSSPLRVDTPPIQASCTTAAIAFSESLLGSRKDGK